MKNSILTLSTEQEAAVDITKNIAVSAGAGSGKTRVLTNRYLRLLDSGIGIEEIIAITFTEKAALEMKERIRGAIVEKLEDSSEDKKKWQKALDKLSRANISTIHSFCAKVIRENAASLGIDFKFNIINEIDKKSVLYEAIGKSQEKIISSGENEEVLKDLVETFGEGYLEDKFKKELMEISEKISQKGRKLEEVFKELQDDELANLVLKILLNTEVFYKEYKIKNDGLDYTDLEMLCKEVLEDKRVRDRYKERYKRFLVDEFQDTNEIQKSIIYSFVSDESGKLLPKRLFVVGDSKQSIYGFRGTDYTIYRKVAKDIGEDGQKSLSTCYRSKPEIIHGINEIFGRLIDQYESLKVPGEESEKIIDEKRLILLTYNKEDSDEESSVKKVKEAIKEKNISVEQFKELLDELKSSYNKVQVKNSTKQEAISKSIRYLFDKGLKAKDICILVRSKYIIPDIEDELKKYNVSYCVIGGRGFYEKEEIKEILNLYELAISDFTKDFSVNIEVRIIKALRSFVFNISDDILYKIKLQQLEIGSLNYFQAMELVYDGMKDIEERKKLENAYLTLLKLSRVETRLCAVQILNAIIETCRIKEALLMQEEGLQKYRNIEKLIFEAEKFDKEKLFTPEEFIMHLEVLNDNNLEDAEASLDSEDTEAVKIMTIHQSKGLEFEGVIIPEMDSDQLKISKKEENKNNLVYYDGKIISKFDTQNSQDENKEMTDEYKSYFQNQLLKEIDESIRVLYVALTRAKQYAVMVGEELAEEVSEISEDSEKITKLNSFMKQVLYAFVIKNADESLIEFVDSSLIPEMYRMKNDTEVTENIDISSIKENLEFKIRDKIRSYVSASKYMKYKKCPRRFYVESVLNIKAANYVGIEEETIDIKTNDLEFIQEEMQDNYDDILEEAAVDILEKDEQAKDQVRYLKSSDMGIVVHKILEYKNSDLEISNELLIDKSMNEILGENNVNSLENKTEVKNRINKYIRNYEMIESNKEPLGEMILKQNEVSFLISPLEDRKTMLTGFIDRLEVYESEGKIIAVITDYKTNHIEDDIALNHLVEKYTSQLNIYGKAIKDNLYVEGRQIDEVRLELYFLEKGICKEVTYDDKKIDAMIAEMDEIFGRCIEDLEVDDFHRTEEDECEKCSYREMCLE
ncbi:UvrD-helicase domain-containing protein [Clostridium beijerinckii]|uniref:UvrD-helicase domain-containing protein n=1 Tax=Clostridium beijerinckii TaxID=1520 RepID=UPI0022E2B86F|nr:UvrD-helicase domain-containing protein [Clostridium beijerinckii]